MEKAKRLTEVALGVIPEVANLDLLVEGPTCREPHGKSDEKVHFPSRNPRSRHPICGKMGTTTLLHAPLD